MDRQRAVIGSGWGLHLVSGGLVRDFRWQGQQQGPLRPEWWIVYWNPEGGGLLRHAGREHRLQASSLSLVAPGTWVERLSPRPMPRQLWAHVVAPGLRPGPGIHRLPLAGLLGEIARATLARLEADGGSPGSGAALQAWACAALAEVARELRAPAGDPWLERLADWLAAHGWPPVPNAVLASRCGMHEKAFCRRFRQLAGRSPQDWLRARRLERAAASLATGATIEDAATLAGCSTRQHFSRLFAAAYGMPPAAWRRLAAPAAAPGAPAAP